MSFGLVLAGLLFFFNPCLSLIDFLPDFIGCLLIYFGIARVATISPVMQEARAKFLKLTLVCVAKDILILMVLGSSAANEKATSLLLIAFSAALLLLWFAFDAFRTLFDGFYGLAVLGNCVPLYADLPRGRHGVKRSTTESALRYALIFLVLREILNVLPEVSALSISSAELNPNYINLYEYVNVMRIMAALVILIFGVIYVIKMVKYFRLVHKQIDFRRELTQKEQDFAKAHPGNALTRRYRRCFGLMGAAAFLLTDFYLDFNNVIPDALAAALLLAGFLASDLSRKNKIIAACGAVIYAVAATISAHYASSFFDKYAIPQIGHNAEADSAYALMWGSALVEMLVFLALLVLVLLSLRCIIDKWGGYLAVQEDSAFESRRRIAFLEEFDGALIRTFVLGFVAALLSFVYDYMKVLPANKWLRFLEFFWAFDFCASLLFAAVFCTLLGNIFAAIKQRFMYD